MSHRNSRPSFMPQESQPRVAITPFEPDVEEQLGKLRRHLQARLRFEALRFLLDFQRQGKYQGRSELTATKIYQAFYEYSIAGGFRQPIALPGRKEAPDTTDAREKKLFNELAYTLDEYYSKPPGANDPIRIEIQRGHGALYEPLITPRNKSVSPQASEVSTGAPSDLASTNGVTIYPNWDRFPELLDTIKRDDADTDDLRIMTMAFANGALPTDKLVELAKRDLRIQLLLTNPISGEWLVRLRHRIRYRFDRETEDQALGHIRDQIARLRFSD